MGKSAHKEVIDKLYDILSNNNEDYYVLVKNLDYGFHHNNGSKHHKHRTTGEIDLLGIIIEEEKKIVELYEVKTGKKKLRWKAKKQLNRCEKHLRKHYLTIDDEVRKYHIYSRYGDEYEINQI